MNETLHQILLQLGIGRTPTQLIRDYVDEVTTRGEYSEYFLDILAPDPRDPPSDERIAELFRHYIKELGEQIPDRHDAGKQIVRLHVERIVSGDAAPYATWKQLCDAIDDDLEDFGLGQLVGALGELDDDYDDCILKYCKAWLDVADKDIDQIKKRMLRFTLDEEARVIASIKLSFGQNERRGNWWRFWRKRHQCEQQGGGYSPPRCAVAETHTLNVGNEKMIRGITGSVLGLSVLAWAACCAGVVYEIFFAPFTGCDVPFSSDFWLYAPPGVGYFVASLVAGGLFVLARRGSRTARVVAVVGSIAVLGFVAWVSTWFVYMLR